MPRLIPLAAAVALWFAPGGARADVVSYTAAVVSSSMGPQEFAFALPDGPLADAAVTLDGDFGPFHYNGTVELGTDRPFASGGDGGGQVGAVVYNLYETIAESASQLIVDVLGNYYFPSAPLPEFDGFFSGSLTVTYSYNQVAAALASSDPSAPLPEPSTVPLLAAGLLGIILIRHARAGY